MINSDIRIISVVGLPGSGKSTFGRYLAKNLESSFIDLDDYITHETGRSPREIIVNDGEPAFRTIEQNHLMYLLDTFSGVLSCGGGTPCFSNNMYHLAARSYVIFLNTDIETIVNRLFHKNNDRPLLHTDNVDELRKNLEELHGKRIGHYLKAHRTIFRDAMEERTVSEIIADVRQYRS